MEGVYVTFTKVTPKTLADMKSRGEKISMITAYDFPTAYIVDEAGIDIILIGDSLGIFMLGYKDTKFVTVDDIIHHSKAVARAVKRALTVGDMPFGAYVNEDVAVINAARIVKEGGVDSVKVEGGREIVDIVKAIVRAGIHVMGHIGFTPQRAVEDSVFPVQGIDSRSAEEIIEDALALSKAGVYALVLEFVAADVSQIIREELDIPIIGIGAGPHCDGQVLIFHDLVGLRTSEPPPYTKQYCNIYSEVSSAIRRYIEDVRRGVFPSRENYISMDRDEYNKLKNKLSISRE